MTAQDGTPPHLPASRRLAAILAMDVLEYSRHMASDEAATLADLRRIRTEIIEPALSARGGRLVKTTGDGFLVEFNSAVEAMHCAMEIQTALARSPGRLKLRAGVNVGDVVIDEGDLFGDGVNIAARLESVASPGGVAFSGLVREYLLGRFDVPFADGGLRDLKNIDRPVHVWHWTPNEVPVIKPEAAPAPPPAPVLPERPSIVVLPFDSLSADPENEFLADGVVESITAVLSRIKTFFVIARNSAFAYKGRHKNIRDIGRELGVAYALEGSVQRAGQRVRITIQLIETATDSHLWAEKYDGSIDEIFDLQDRITERVAGALQPSIRQAEIERARRKRPQEMGAYDYAMRAMRHVWALEQEEADTALELLGQALTLDADYPLAMALSAWCWAQRGAYNWVPEPLQAKLKALDLANRASQLSTDDPLILAILGAVQCMARQYGPARVMLERAVALDPNAAWATSRLAWLYVYTDNPVKAREFFERALRLSPLDPINFNNYVGMGASYQGRVDPDDHAAADLLSKALQERPHAIWIHRNLAPALYGAGRLEEAKASLRTLMTHHPDFTVQGFLASIPLTPYYTDRICEQLRALGVPEGNAPPAPP